MATHVRTLDFLPEIFRTNPNKQFLGATLDQLVNQPNVTKIQGYIGRKFEKGLNPNDSYITEIDKTRTNYQLEPAVVFKKPEVDTAADFISYPGIIDSLAADNGITDNHSVLFNNEFYAWDSFIDLDKLINFSEYYWLPNGPDSISVSNSKVNNQIDYTVQSNLLNYTFKANEIPVKNLNPILTLIRGGKYTFRVNQNTTFWIQTAPGTNGIDSNRQDVSSREVYGVIDNGISDGTVTFEVPFADAQKEFDLPGNNEIDLVSEIHPEKIHGKRLSEIIDLNGIDGSVILSNKTVIFYGFEPGSIAELKALYDEFEFDKDSTSYSFSNYTVFTDFIYEIEYLSVDSGDPIIALRQKQNLPVNEKIKVLLGQKFIGKTLARDEIGYISILPQITAPLDTLYYQDAENPSKVGVIKLIENKNSNPINVEESIIGKKTYTSPNDIKFTNGLKINFIGDIVPEKYKTGQYYVEGVGESISLVNVKDLDTPEPFTEAVYTVFDDSFDITQYDATINVPRVKDYITINRNSINKNAWSRGNRWFHSDVLKASIKHTAGKISLAALNNGNNRAKRPIIEFYPNLKLFNYGTMSKGLIDFVDVTATNALNSVNGKLIYKPDGDEISLFTGCKIIFTKDNDLDVRNKIFVVDYTAINQNGQKVIVLSKAMDGDVEEGDTVYVLRGKQRSGTSWHFDGTNWKQAQQKVTVNQPPLFDVVNSSNISLSDQSYYNGSSFRGTTLFEYAKGTGNNDPVLNFPIKYSSVSNLGDIRFNVSINSDTFTYVDRGSNITKNIKLGYPVIQTDRYNFTKRLGWVNAIDESFQYQAFNFQYNLIGTPEFTCSVLPKDSTSTKWPVIKVFLDDILQESKTYTVTYKNKSTIITLKEVPTRVTAVQVLIYSNDKLSSDAYYTIPSNLANNPFNEDIGAIDLGDIRNHFQSICINSNIVEGQIIGSNNYRDLGNLLPYGDRIIQNSAPLTLAGAFLRNKNYNLIDALSYNSIEYTKFKALLFDTIVKTAYDQHQANDEILDDALQQISNFKNKNGPFFWSDMLPSGAPLISNTYTFNAFIDTGVFPLSRVYDFTTANYYGVLVYLSEIEKGVVKKRILLKDVDYTISNSQPKLTLTKDLTTGQKIIINEYSQTYGSYVPNTPTKLGLYPLHLPKLIYDDSYVNPTWFIKGHDGSYTRVIGEVRDGELVNLVDRIFLEFELRIYNNIKTSDRIPLIEDDVIPGFFRKTDYDYDQVLKIYLSNFLDWIGQNRVEHKQQYFVATNKWTWNYRSCTNKVDGKPILQGNWRGIYKYFFDTSTPHTTPWEMLGFADKPIWWDKRYGEAPYTSNNKLLWDDIENGINYNYGNPKVIKAKVRPGLSKILPVDSVGKLISPFDVLIGDYDQLSFNKDWQAGDYGPAEFSYIRSSSYPFDVLKLLALTKPAKFYALAQNIDTYEYSYDFNQFLLNNRLRITSSAGLNYGNGSAHHGYTNFIIDYIQRNGILGFEKINELLSNLDVRLVYRVAGFTDKDLLNFYLEKSSPNTKNKSLILPENNYSIILYDNQPFDIVSFSSVIIQRTEKGYKVYGNSQNKAYFKTYTPIINRNVDVLVYEKIRVEIHKDFSTKEIVVPYGTEFVSPQSLAEFIKNYGRYLEGTGFKFENIENGMQVDWNQMIIEVLYWMQSGWEVGSTININPAANGLKFNKENCVLQPLAFSDNNFVLDQNLIPIANRDLEIRRDGTEFEVLPLNTTDTLALFNAAVTNIEHAIIFDNKTLFNDTIYNVTTGLRHYRLLMKGVKTAEWNGLLDARGFILNQDNIIDWKPNTKYTKGTIVKYKNVYWVASNILQPAETFNQSDWIKSDYDKIQKGLLPNASTRAFESSLYYDTTSANLKNDADLLAFGLIGYRPRDYLAVSNLNDISQVNVFKNIISQKGTRLISESMQNVELSTGQIKYDVYENWAIKTGEHGGVLNQNFVDFKLDESKLTSNPSIVSLIKDKKEIGSMYEVPLSAVTNYNKTLIDENILSVKEKGQIYKLPSAGYVNFEDVKAYGITFDQINKTNFPPTSIYQGNYIWIANNKGTWDVFVANRILGSEPIVVYMAQNNLDGTTSLMFDKPHGLKQDDLIIVLQFNEEMDGYHLVQKVVNTTTIVVNKQLDPQTATIATLGFAVKLQSQRVKTTQEINTLSLVNNGFTKTKYWVDNAFGDSSDDWAVYQKSLNYRYNPLITPDNTGKFGSAVAHHDDFGYLVTDAESTTNVGKLYHYDEYFNLTNTITGERYYGTAVAKAGSVLFVSQPDTNSKIFVYNLVNGQYGQRLINQRQEISILNKKVGEKLAVSGDGHWLFVSAIDTYEILVYRLINSDYVLVNTIQAPNLDRFATAPQIPDLGQEYFNTTENKKYICTKQRNFVSGVWTNAEWNVSDDKFGFTLATNYDGSKLYVGAPYENYSFRKVNVGYVYVFTRIVEKVVQKIRAVDGAPFAFSTHWQVQDIVNKNKTKISVDGVTIDESAFQWQNEGNSTNISITPYVSIGKIVEISTSDFVFAEKLQSYTDANTLRPGIAFGYGLDCNVHSTEVLIGAPFDVSEDNNEGIVQRFTNQGKKFGSITSTGPIQLSQQISILINGFGVSLPNTGIDDVVKTINLANIPNITAIKNLNNTLTIKLLENQTGQINNKLNITLFDHRHYSVLKLNDHVKTQELKSLSPNSSTQFGSEIKFNQFGSFAVGAPFSDRLVSTTFDFTDDENYENDTLFDNGFTSFVDNWERAGSVYIYDYLPAHNETINDVGQFVFSQFVNDLKSQVGLTPKYGSVLAFNNYSLVVGCPDYSVSTGGRTVVYKNYSKQPNWSIYRKSEKVVDVNKIHSVQLYDNLSNERIEALDYIDPMQGKLLGVVNQNLDYITANDPAGYTNSELMVNNFVWGENELGKIWFDVTNTRFVNSHQNNLVYNAKNWGKVFPGSVVTVYTWIESNTMPIDYTGPGTPYNLGSYTSHFKITNTGTLVNKYYFWVRNTNKIYTEYGKTLSDKILEEYIANPQSSGIAFMAALKPNVYSLYNSKEYINDTSTSLSIRYSNIDSGEPTQNEFALIRDGHQDDFLSGFPSVYSDNTDPTLLYEKLLDSLAGLDEKGQVIPDIYIPKLLQTGTGIRPRQSFFVNRLKALENYCNYANSVLKQYPIAEFKIPSFLNIASSNNDSTGRAPAFFLASGEDYDTTQYWEYIYWWAEGYSNSTKVDYEVPQYYGLSGLPLKKGMVVGVTLNGDGKREVYTYDGSSWIRVGLEQGTIQIKSSLWDYNSYGTGYGNQFFDSVNYDKFPSKETRYILRALNEQVYTGALRIHRNKSLILLFEYIISETNNNTGYLPWLNKTSFVDIGHTLRTLEQDKTYQQDNQSFLEGFMNEVKPYHVVIKDFAIRYDIKDEYSSTVSDFDLPATYNPIENNFVIPNLVFKNPQADASKYLPTDKVWNNKLYKDWFENYGLSLLGQNNYPITRLKKYITKIGNKIYVENAYGFPNNGVIKIDEELIGYQKVDRENHVLTGITRGVNGTIITDHIPNKKIYIDLPGVIVLETGRDYIDPPVITAYIDTDLYPAPFRAAHLEPIMDEDKVIGVQVIDPGAGYSTKPEIVVQPSKIIKFDSNNINQLDDTLKLDELTLKTGDCVRFLSGTGGRIKGLTNRNYYYVRVVKADSTLETLTPTSIIAFYETKTNALKDNHRIDLTKVGDSFGNTIELTARIITFAANSPVRELSTKIKFDRTSYRSLVTNWTPNEFYFAAFTPSGYESSLGDNLSKAELIKKEVSGVTTGHGTNPVAKFNVYYYVYQNTYAIELFYSGQGYSVNDLITISGDLLNGTSPDNDLVIKVNTVGTLGAILTATVQSGYPYISPANMFKNRASMQGARIDITNVDNTAQNTVVTVDFSNTKVTTPQLKGLRVYFYKNPISYIWKDEPTVGDLIVGKEYRILSTNGTDFRTFGAANNNVGTTFTATGNGIVEAGSFIIGKTYTIIRAGNTDFRLVGAANNNVGTTFTATGIGTGDGKARQGSGKVKRVGSATIEFYRPNFGTNNIVNEYYVNIIEPGWIYNKDDEIRVKGSLLGGVDGKNDAFLKIIYVVKDLPTSPGGAITIYELTGVAAKMFDQYFVKPLDESRIGLFRDAPMVRPVKSSEMVYTSDDWIYLPEPVIVTSGYTRSPASLVSYKNKLYRCLVSNKDTEFDFDKWEEVLSDDEELNALDRIMGYYQPRSSMPGKNLPMLVSGIDYPNNTYYANKFNENIPVETKVQGQQFYPVDINIRGITNSTTEYFAVADTKTHTILLSSDDGKTWGYKNISDKKLGVTDIYYSESIYIATTTNTKSPLITSADGKNWLTAGVFIPFDSIRGFDGDDFDDTALNVPDCTLYGVVYHNNNYHAVGDRIISSSDGYNWQEIFNFGSKLKNEFRSIAYCVTTSYQGYIAVGGGFVYGSVGEPQQGVEFIQQEIPVSRIFTSPTGYDWSETPSRVGEETLNVVFASNDKIIAAGDNAKIYYSPNATNWVAANIVDESYTNKLYAGIYAFNTYVIVGEKGLILISYDGMTWSNVSSGTTKDLRAVTFNEDHFIVTGDNATILKSYDAVTWDDVSFVKTPNALFEIRGDEFTAGYGPEELIAGALTDNLSITVRTKPGATWPENLIPFTGFNISVVEATSTKDPISFASAAENPVQVQVYVVDKQTQLAKKVYENITATENNPYTYTVNWMTKTITFNKIIDLDETIYIEVYEVGGGNHLAKSTSQSKPLQIDPITGNSQILLGYAHDNTFYTTPIVFCNGRKLIYSIDYNIVANFDKQSKILFTRIYDPKVDYIAFTILGNTKVNFVEYSINEQYGYSVPIQEKFLVTTSNTFTISNLVNFDNPESSIVELNGLRLTKDSDYTLTVNPTSLIGTLQITSATEANDIVSITTYNDTRQQSLVTETKNIRINAIESIDFALALPIITIRHQPNFVSGDLVRIDGVKGTVQLNNNTYYADVTDGFTKPQIQTLVYAGSNVFELLYSQIQDFSTAVVQKNNITVPTIDWDLVPDPQDPLKATLTYNATLVTGDIITVNTTDGITYYSLTLYNDPLLTAAVRAAGVLSAYQSGGYIWKDSDTIQLGQPNYFELVNTQRLHVSVEGQRLHPNLLKLNSDNKLNILKELNESEDILITSMVPYASPNEMVFKIDVDKNGDPTVYRANTSNKTWLTQPLNMLDNVVYVEDVSRLIDIAIEEDTVIEISKDVLGCYLDYDIAAIKQVSIYNETSLTELDSSDHILLSKNSRLYVKFKDGVELGHKVRISVRLGDTILVGSEKIRFKAVNYKNNTVFGLTRGVDGTGTKAVYDIYETVISLTPRNILPNFYYDKTWNSENFRDNGDLLQVSDFFPARFLRVGTK